MHSTQRDPGSTQHEKNFRKSWDFFHNRQFCGFIFKFVWAVYGGDLIGFCLSSVSVVAQGVPGLDADRVVGVAGVDENHCLRHDVARDRKVILKNDQQQTKIKKSQKVPGYEPL